MVLILADNDDGSQRIERECATAEEAEVWLREHPYITGRIVDKDAHFRDVLKNATA